MTAVGLRMVAVTGYDELLEECSHPFHRASAWVDSLSFKTSASKRYNLHSLWSEFRRVDKQGEGGAGGAEIWGNSRSLDPKVSQGTPDAVHSAPAASRRAASSFAAGCCALALLHGRLS